MIEDNADDAVLIQRELRRSGYDVAYERVDNAVGLTAALAKGPWDVVFADHSMPEFAAPVALQMVRTREPDVPFIIVSGTMGEEAAVAAMHTGANDYFVKGRLGRLGAALERELRQARARRTHHALE
ncbi:MAG: response regulator, partial [Candidatus Limnocylindria bacterium]